MGLGLSKAELPRKCVKQEPHLRNLVNDLERLWTFASERGYWQFLPRSKRVLGAVSAHTPPTRGPRRATKFQPQGHKDHKERRSLLIGKRKETPNQFVGLRTAR
jgi:hypothetical protein